MLSRVLPDRALHGKVGNHCSEAYQVHLNQIFSAQPINSLQSRTIISQQHYNCRYPLSEALHIV